MDVPEQTDVWPPAPKIAPPKPVKAERLKLIVPEWVRYWCRSAIWFLAVHLIVPAFCEIDHVPTPRWSSFPAAMATWFILGGLLTLWKYWLKRKKY